MGIATAFVERNDATTCKEVGAIASSLRAVDCWAFKRNGPKTIHQYLAVLVCAVRVCSKHESVSRFTMVWYGARARK